MSTIIFLLAILKVSAALIGYYCGSRSMNITTLSLLGVGPCEIPNTRINATKQYIQLLQINQFRDTPAIQCKIEVRRTVLKCGMFSHISFVVKSQTEYIHEISREKCEQIHNTGMLRIGSNIMNNLKVNDTVVYPITLAGKIDNDGGCSGTSYADPYGQWDNVVVQGTIKIELREQLARVDINENKIYLRSGTNCKLSTGNCIDMEGGYTFWRTIPTDSCNFYQYGLLYEAYAMKMEDTDSLRQSSVYSQDIFSVYSLSSQDVTFALSTRSRESVCRFKIWHTEHPKLFIFETSFNGESFVNKTKISVENLDLFTYINSKFVYVERYMRNQVQSLYQDVIKK